MQWENDKSSAVFRATFDLYLAKYNHCRVLYITDRLPLVKLTAQQERGEGESLSVYRFCFEYVFLCLSLLAEHNSIDVIVQEKKREAKNDFFFFDVFSSGNQSRRKLFSVKEKGFE